MSKFLNPELVCRSFKRLASRERIGKKHLERTSVLMYFLAFDATCKHFGFSKLNFDPGNIEGKYCRKRFEIEFTRLATISSTQDCLKQVIELGKIDTNGTAPGQRLSSNFFSVPVKKASYQKEPYYYPRRPPAPVLRMGPLETNVQWGIDYCENWRDNFPKLFSEIKESTPFLDLAIYVLRDSVFNDNESSFVSAINEQLSIKFTKDLFQYWVSKVDVEKIFAKDFNPPFVENHQSFVAIYDNDPVKPEIKYEEMRKNELVKRVKYLESLLSKHHIKY